MRLLILDGIQTFDFERRVLNHKLIAQRLFDLIRDDVALFHATVVEHHVRVQGKVLRGERPDMQFVYVGDIWLRFDHLDDLSRTDASRRGF